MPQLLKSAYTMAKRQTRPLAIASLVASASTAIQPDISYSNAGDFVVFCDGPAGQPLAGKVQFHFEVSAIAVSVIELYELVSRSDDYVVWQPASDIQWIESEYIIDPVVYNTLPDGKVEFQLPLELR